MLLIFKYMIIGPVFRNFKIAEFISTVYYIFVICVKYSRYMLHYMHKKEGLEWLEISKFHYVCKFIASVIIELPSTWRKCNTQKKSENRIEEDKKKHVRFIIYSVFDHYLSHDSWLCLIFSTPLCKMKESYNLQPIR